MKTKRISERKFEAMLGRMIGRRIKNENAVCTFSEAGVLTSDKGLVVNLPNGQEFQITIVESRGRGCRW